MAGKVRGEATVFGEGVHVVPPHGAGIADSVQEHDPWPVPWAAISPKYSGRLRPPASITGRGEDELAALTDLVTQLRELRAIERQMALEAKARTAFVGGAEEYSRATLGRPLTQDELERIIVRYR